MARPNWSRILPRPLVIPTVIQLSTLAEVRALLDRHLPPQTLKLDRLGLRPASAWLRRRDRPANRCCGAWAN